MILGVGLIGGSVGKALRARGLADRIVGVGRDPARLDEACRLGAIDEASGDLASAVADADLAVICTPVSRIADDCLTIARWIPSHALITDVGSTKLAIADAVDADPVARSKFCGAHPIAGSEHQGVAHARADLFDGRSCVITPTSSTLETHRELATQFWGSLGCRVLVMSPQDHDRALALTSHLPHAVASALASTVPCALHPLAAGAFRDGTRVAASGAELWTEIFLANRDATLVAISAFSDRLDQFRRALVDGDAEQIADWWRAGQSSREQFTFEAPAPAHESPPSYGVPK